MSTDWDNEDLCTCGHERIDHCQDPDHCYFNDGEWGGCCNVVGCPCYVFTMPKEVHENTNRRG